MGVILESGIKVFDEESNLSLLPIYKLMRIIGLFVTLCKVGDIIKCLCDTSIIDMGEF